ncbi:MAG: hypothetical protein Q9187_009681 [Circinaria calcarea]
MGPTATSFFLGILFSLFPYDYPILWTTPSPTHLNATASAFSAYSGHLSLLYASPPLIPRLLHIVVAIGLLGFFLKLYRPSESNLLFDGASLGLYVVGIIVYVTNIASGLKAVAEGEAAPLEELQARGTEAEGELVDVSTEDGLRVLAASNTILALVMVGVLVLQAGQWYAERKEGQEVERWRREAGEKRKGVGAGGAGKKKI